MPDVRKNPPKALTRGQGDSSTMWQGWRIKFDKLLEKQAYF